MQSKLIHDANGQKTYAIILSSGDEVIECLNAFARAERHKWGALIKTAGLKAE